MANPGSILKLVFQALGNSTLKALKHLTVASWESNETPVLLLTTFEGQVLNCIVLLSSSVSEEQRLPKRAAMKTKLVYFDTTAMRKIRHHSLVISQLLAAA